MLAAEWKASASAKGTPRRRANAAPTVDLPDPETPMTTIGVLGRQGFSAQIAVPLQPAHAAASVGGADGGPHARKLAYPPVEGDEAHRRVSAHLNGGGDTTGIDGQRCGFR